MLAGRGVCLMFNWIMLRRELCCAAAFGRCLAGDRRLLRNIMSALRGLRAMPRDASELARRLARDVEAVCRHYLSNGRRQGCYWTVGDVRNTPGRSMFVRLSGPDSGPGAKPGIGPTPPRPNMAISSTSSARAAG